MSDIISDGSRTVFEEVTVNHIVFIAWVVTAGLYGYLVSEYGSASVDMQSVSLYPENAYLFMLFGLGVGVAFSASVVSMLGENDV